MLQLALKVKVNYSFTAGHLAPLYISMWYILKCLLLEML